MNTKKFTLAKNSTSVNTPQTSAKAGFTLAEVLITLSIIAVVSILTIPSVVKNYRYKSYAAAAQKTYAQITDAINTIMTEEMESSSFYRTTAGVKNSCTAGKETGACYFLRNYFKVNNDCTSSALNTKCTAKEYKSINGANAGVPFGSHCIQNSNGATICMTLNTTNGVASLFIDVNGPAQPNITGLDVYVASIDGTTGELKDWSLNSDTCNTKSSSYGHVADYASGCLYKLMKNGWVITD